MQGSTEMLETKPLPNSPFGVEILGLDLARSVSDETLKDLLRIFHEHALIMIRGQYMDFDRYDWLTLQFGNHHPHFLDHLRLEGHPAILMLSNIIENGKPIGVFEGAAYWHTDVAYEDPPNSSTIVYGRESCEQGCPTHFCDTRAAYDALSDTMKDRINDLTVLHHYGNRDDLNEESTTSAEKLTDDQRARVKNVFHPLAKIHPFTGRRSLYGVAGSSFGIVGMPDDEAFELLEVLKDHALQPCFTTSLDFGVGDVGAWDTYATLHKATVLEPATGSRDRRLLWRISVNGYPRLLANEIKHT